MKLRVSLPEKEYRKMGETFFFFFSRDLGLGAPSTTPPFSDGRAYLGRSEWGVPMRAEFPRCRCVTMFPKVAFLPSFVLPDRPTVSKERKKGRKEARDVENNPVGPLSPLVLKKGWSHTLVSPARNKERRKPCSLLINCPRNGGQLSVYVFIAFA